MKQKNTGENGQGRQHDRSGTVRTLTAVEALKEAGAIVVGVAVIVERGAKQAILDAGYKYYAAYSLEDLGL